MTQTAVRVSAADNLFVFSPKSLVLSEDNHRAETIQRELSDVNFINDPGVFFYNNRIRLTFGLASQSSRHFILVKGLIEFSRSAKFLFSYNKEERTIEADINENDFPALKTYLDNVSGWLSKEVSFRQNLKTVIDFEARYRSEKELLYASLLK